VDQSDAAVGADMQLHAEIPLIALLALAHLRVAPLVFVLGRGRGGDQGGIYNSGVSPVGGGS
jgi:hypothetical protein